MERSIYMDDVPPPRWIWGSLHFELRILRNILHEICSHGNLSDEQECRCREIFVRIEYLRYLVMGGSEDTPSSYAPSHDNCHHP